MKMPAAVALVTLSLLLAACGNKGPLVRASDVPTPPPAMPASEFTAPEAAPGSSAPESAVPAPADTIAPPPAADPPAAIAPDAVPTAPPADVDGVD